MTSSTLTPRSLHRNLGSPRIRSSIAPYQYSILRAQFIERQVMSTALTACVTNTYEPRHPGEEVVLDTIAYL